MDGSTKSIFISNASRDKGNGADEVRRHEVPRECFTRIRPRVDTRSVPVGIQRHEQAQFRFHAHLYLAASPGSFQLFLTFICQRVGPQCEGLKERAR